VRALIVLAVIALASCKVERPVPPATDTHAGNAPGAGNGSAATIARDPVDNALQVAREILAKGDEPNAIVAFNQLITDLPEGERRAAVRCELATVLNNRAPRIFKDDARAGDIEARRALELCPGNDVLKQNRARMLVARASREDRNVAEARARQRDWLEESLALHEPDADAHFLLGEALFVDDEVTNAAVHLKRALALRPNDERLAARVADIEKKAAVEGSFRDNRREHFVARFEGDAHEQLSWTALDHLEKAYFLVGGKLGLHPREQITVVIYTGNQYKQVSNVPDWADGSFDGKIRIREGSLQLAQGQLEGLLRHEYTHAALATLPKPIPTWLNEGLAQHFEGEDMSRLRRFLARAKGESALLPFTTMQGSFVAIKEPAQAQVAYATAALMVRALVDKRGEYALQTLMSRLVAGESFDGAFEATYAITPHKLYDTVVDGL
jgi:hypothetical protein